MMMKEFLDNGDGEITLSDRRGAVWSPHHTGIFFRYARKEVMEWLAIRWSKLSQALVDWSGSVVEVFGYCKMWSWPKVGLISSQI